MAELKRGAAGQGGSWRASPDRGRAGLSTTMLSGPGPMSQATMNRMHPFAPASRVLRVWRAATR